MGIREIMHLGGGGEVSGWKVNIIYISVKSVIKSIEISGPHINPGCGQAPIRYNLFIILHNNLIETPIY